MPEFTLNEKRVIIQILTLIMKADSIINPAEVSFLDRIFNEFQLQIEEFDHMEEIDFEQLASEHSSFTMQKKEYAHKLFVEMSECDGFVDPRELALIAKLS